MIPVTFWFHFRCGAILGVSGEMPALPRVGDSVAASSDDFPGDWVVTAIMHNMYGDRRVEVDIKTPETDETMANMTRRDRIRMRKQIVNAGWIMIDETGTRK
jgi:hypothetical protein